MCGCRVGRPSVALRVATEPRSGSGRRGSRASRGRPQRGTPAGTAALAAAVDGEEDCSLYFGLTGTAVALRAVHRLLGDPTADRAAARALNRVRSRFDGRRWGEMFELLFGNAGIAMGALHAGDLDLAVLAVEPYLAAADPTPGGVNWTVRPSPARSHHIAHGTLGIVHGTLGIVHALVAVGAAAGRDDLLALAVAGAADVVSRDEAGPAGFLVPHPDPPHRPELIERYSYGWCNGPAGDAQVFRLLGALTKDPAWIALADRRWHTVTHCGLPRRVRLGFWDNNGRCCGTAGVLALACDRHVEQAESLETRRRPTLGRDPPPQGRRPHPRRAQDDPSRPTRRRTDLRHTVLARAMEDYLRWRNTNARHSDVLAAQRRERARISHEKQRRWGRPGPSGSPPCPPPLPERQHRQGTWSTH